MSNLRHVILFSGAAATAEHCVYCHGHFTLQPGYQVLAQDGTKPDMATFPVCRPCVGRHEPALVEMLELTESYVRFNAGADFTMQGQVREQ